LLSPALEFKPPIQIFCNLFRLNSNLSKKRKFRVFKYEEPFFLIFKMKKGPKTLKTLHGNILKKHRFVVKNNFLKLLFISIFPNFNFFVDYL
jgi:hypothetical protein